MGFSTLLGNERLKENLTRSLKKGHISHFYLISGPEGSGKHMLAHLLSAAILCEGTEPPCMSCQACRRVLEDIHPDVIWVEDKDKKTVTVDLMRQARADAFIRPNEAARKVYIIADSHQLNERDQNVLLKIVEEGPPYAAFVFCTDSPSALLETVRSRCVLLKYDAVSEDALPPEAEQLCRAFARGKVLPVTTYLVALENRRMKREELRDVLRGAWCAAAEALLLQMGKQTPDPACGETAQALARGLTARQLRQLTALLEKYSERVLPISGIQ